MKKGKYNLSKSAVDNLMQKLERIAQENFEDIEEPETLGLQEAQITTSFVKSMTKVKGLEDVIERNTQLTRSFRGYLDMYGFETMYDMYIYAKSCDVVPEELMKRKDYSKLVPVKRKVMRNGKEHEVTVWEDPNKGDKDKNKEEDSQSTGTGKKPKKRKLGRHARELKSDVVKDNAVKNPNNVAKLKAAAMNMPNGNKPFKDGSNYYIVLKDENVVDGVAGYSDDGEYITMDFYRSNGEVSGVAARCFFELIKLAVQESKGVKMEDIQEARPIFMQAGLENREDGFWYIEAEELQRLMSFKGTMNE